MGICGGAEGIGRDVRRGEGDCGDDGTEGDIITEAAEDCTKAVS